ncbi:MAG: hypothetical protein QW719_01870, partial [Candidatus Micrarchaeaceae archaeon]
MQNPRKRYEKDFYYTHYTKFVLPFWAYLLSHAGIIILFFIFITFVAAVAFFYLAISQKHLFEIWIAYFAFISADYVLARVPWKRGAVRASASIRAAGGPHRGKIPIRPVDMKNYIAQKANKNIFICGTSGQGKSYLTRYLLSLYDSQKLIFNFKPNDEYLKMGYPIVAMSGSLPNPFENTESFVNAFLITFPLDSVGITAQYIPAFVRELAKESATWQDFGGALSKKLASTKDKIQKSALLFIQEHTKSLASRETYAVEIGSGSLVFDFSSLNEDAKTFYAELVLRRLWHEISSERKADVLICIDEAHRLLHRFQKYESIYNEMAREIRAFGMLWTSSQNYSDLQNDLRNQFATQFIFNTSHP